MDYKKEFKDFFSDLDYLNKLREESVKTMFLISSFLFFFNLFLISAEFGGDILLKTVIVLFFVFLTSFCLYIYLFLNNKIKLNKINKVFIILFLSFIYILFLLPFLGIGDK